MAFPYSSSVLDKFQSASFGTLFKMWVCAVVLAKGSVASKSASFSGALIRAGLKVTDLR